MNIEEFNSDPYVILLRRWSANCRRAQIANYSASGKFSSQNYWLGIPVVLLTATVGTSVFTALGSNEVSKNIQILVGIISVLATVLSALQTFLRWGERASKCRAIAAEYGAVKREIDQMLSARTSIDDFNDEEISKVRNQLDTLSRDAPELPNSIWKQAMEKVPLAKK